MTEHNNTALTISNATNYNAPEVSFDFTSARAAAVNAAPALFDRPNSDEGKKKKGGIQGLALGRSDEFRLSLADVSVRQGWNSRDFANPKNKEHVLWLADNIKENGVLVSLEVTWEDGVAYLVDGHCRFFACLYAVAHLNAEIHSIPVKNVHKSSNEIDHLYAQVNRNSGRQLLPLELGLVYARAIKMGETEAMIARRVSKSVTHVNQLLLLQGAPREIKQWVGEDKFGAYEAITVIQKANSPAEAVETIGKAIEDAASKGKSKATRKNVGAVTGRISATVRVKQFETARAEQAEVVRSNFALDTGTGKWHLELNDEQAAAFRAFMGL